MSISITEHQIYSTHSTYDVVFYGEPITTTVTHDPNIVTQWIAAVQAISNPGQIVGLDIEWRPTFGPHEQIPVATLQLCIDNRCLIYQLIHTPFVPGSLVDFLSNRSYKFVGVGIHDDLGKLRNDYNLGNNANAVDLRDMATAAYGRDEFFRRASLMALSRMFLDKEIEKSMDVRVSNWDDWRLTLSQVEYACVDAVVSYQLGKMLNWYSSPQSHAGP